MIHKGAELDEKFQDPAKEAGQLYKQWTKRMWVVERIIADRLGYAPQRIDDPFLSAHLKKMDKYQARRYIIREERQIDGTQS